MSDSAKVGKLTLKVIHDAVTGTASAFRRITQYQPAGGPGDKVFPPTYAGGKYATEKRRLPGSAEPVDCVLLDSVQSQANRMELALLQAWERGQIPLPVITVDFGKDTLPKPLRVTSLEAPHRVADALIRDSLFDKQPFRKSAVGKRLDDMDPCNATALFELCPTALIFGLWDSTGPRGGQGAKFQRALVSEIVGFEAVTGLKTSSRIDPAQIMLHAGPLYRTSDGGWTLDAKQAVKDKKEPVKFGKDGKPSEANHGNILPTIAEGGVTISRAGQTTVLSLPALRRLRFPIKGKADVRTDDAARTALAALAMCAATLIAEQGCDLRSRCQLHPVASSAWDLLDRPGEEPPSFGFSIDESVALLSNAVNAAKDAGLRWMDKELVLQASPQLVEIVRRSQELAAQTITAEESA
jgi:CRISPR-associated protein Csb1